MFSTLRTTTALLALAAFALPASAQDMTMYMADLQPAEGVESDGTGMASVTIDPAAMTLTWEMTYEGLTGDPVAAHFHGPAGPDESAPPVIDMTADMEDMADEALPQDIMSGTVEITEDQLAMMRDGMTYINVHTEQYPDGEIRGQVVEGEADMGAMGDAATE